MRTSYSVIIMQIARAVDWSGPVSMRFFVRACIHVSVRCLFGLLLAVCQWRASVDVYDTDGCS